MRHLTFPACREPGIWTYVFGRGNAYAKRVWATGTRNDFELVAAVGESWRGRLAAKMLAAKTRIMVWGRSRGLSRSKATLWWSRLIRQ